jgi:hypothetical protein
MLYGKRLIGLVCSLLLLGAGLTLVTATAPVAQAATCVPQLAANALPCGGGGGGGGGGGSGVDPLPGTPRYALEAVWFQCVDETGQTQIGSDETRFSFNAIDGQGVRTQRSETFDDVDSGVSFDFHPSFRQLAPAGGSIAPLSLAINITEIDSWPDYDDTIGHSDLAWSGAELAQAVPNVGMSTVRPVTFTGDSSNYVVYLVITRVS